MYIIALVYAFSNIGFIYIRRIRLNFMNRETLHCSQYILAHNFPVRRRDRLVEIDCVSVTNEILSIRNFYGQNVRSYMYIAIKPITLTRLKFKIQLFITRYVFFCSLLTRRINFSTNLNPQFRHGKSGEHF